jgi:hypothetical protein
MNDPADTVLAEAARLRSLGMSPIPIVRWKGHCPEPYGAYREGGMPPSVFEGIVRRKAAHGIQCFTSAAWGIVADLDGYEGVRKWDSWARRLGCPPTWETITPSGGVQKWFDVPGDVAWVPKVHLWRGEGHQGVEILGDGAQARCWPSYKILEGRKVPYVWDADRRPGRIPRATLPRWALDLALALRPPGSASPDLEVAPIPPPRPRPVGPRRLPEWSDVRDGIDPPEKVRLARAWGLRFRSSAPNAGGWMRCHSVFREDREASAMFCPRTGGYWEDGLGVRNFFWLALQLGAYPDFPTALADLAPLAGYDRRIA